MMNLDKDMRFETCQLQFIKELLLEKVPVRDTKTKKNE